MGKVRQIKNALVKLVSNLEYEGEPAFTSVSDNTSDDFKDFPAVRVLPSPDLIMNEIGTMPQNDRTVRFNVVVHDSLESLDKIQSAVIDGMTDRADLLLDTFDAGDFTDKLKEIDPTLGDYMMSVPSVSLDPVDSKAGALLMLVATVEVKYSKDL